MNNYQSDLIYDIGMHKGEDTEFYLKKGFRVVAVEANASLCEENLHAFRSEVKKGQLIIVNRAISDKPGLIKFFINEGNSVWGTTNLDWVKRNEARGTASYAVEIEATTICQILEEFGTPYYMKVDIEGADIECLKGLLSGKERPKHISIESSATSLSDTLEQINLLKYLGYTKYKIIAQHKVVQHKCPYPAREGVYVDHHFQYDSSGLFGNETPGAWKSVNHVKMQYYLNHFHSRMVGLNNGIFRNVPSWKIRKALEFIFFRGIGWYDTHATF